MVSQPRVDVRPDARAALRRPLWSRISSAHILIVAAGVLAFVANMALIRPPADPPLVAVAATDLLPGTVFDPATHVTTVPMSTDEATLDALVVPAEADLLAGSVVRRLVPAGAPITDDVLEAPTTSEGWRLMSVPLDVTHAAGGAIGPGDRVDLVAVDDGVASYVVTGVEVVRVPPDRRDALSVSSGYFLVVAVDDEAVLRVAAALDTSSVHVVRSTGTDAPGRRRYRWTGA